MAEQAEHIAEQKARDVSEELLSGYRTITGNRARAGIGAIAAVKTCI